MKKLEELLGVRLIERSNRGSHLTPEGKAFYTKISHILGELEAVVSELPGRAATAQPLAVGIMLSLGDVHMNRHLPIFRTITAARPFGSIIWKCGKCSNG